MEFVTHAIESNDFAEAGAAARQIKQHLKRIGADADAIRRTMIAAYEAEMNVVIHAVGGRLQATIGEHQVDIDVIDDGPGIADLDQALREGFSTASSDARALGFGAGMGLPNIKRNADRFGIVSKVGQGTRLSFTVLLQGGATTNGRRTSLTVLPELCRDCRRCVTACPTHAVRVRDAVPAVLEHLCIDCTRCIAVCAPRALTVAGVSGGGLETGGLLAVPPALLVGFGEHAAPGDVLVLLRDLGFDDVVSVHPYEDALAEAVVELAAKRKHPWPVISPVCPAVVDLIELRFPSLLGHLAPFVSPWEALQLSVAGRPATLAVSCPSQRSALLGRAVDGQTTIVTPAAVRAAVAAKVAALHTAAATDVPAAARPAPLRVTGIDHVLAVLERIEDGLLTGVPALEPFACDQGCFGSPLLGEDAYLAGHRWQASGGAADAQGKTFARTAPFAPRAGIRLDADMAHAIEKLALLDATVRSLPGKDCGVCGAPTCACLAEDIVMQRVTRDLCPYATTEEEMEP